MGGKSFARLQHMISRSREVALRRTQARTDLPPEVTCQPILKPSRDQALPPASHGSPRTAFSQRPALHSQVVSVPRGPNPQPRTVLIHRRRDHAREKLAPLNLPGYGGSRELQSALGLSGEPTKPDDAAVLVAIDTETELQGLLIPVVEVGITVLRVRDILGVSPGEHLRNWLPKMQHHHFVLDHTRKPRYRMRSSLFGRSQFLAPAEAQEAVKRVLRDCIGGTTTPAPTADNSSTTGPNPPKIYLVGHSVIPDIQALRGPGLRLELSNPTQVPFRFTQILDTHTFSSAVKRRRDDLQSLKLGSVVRYLGVDPQYFIPDAEGSQTVVGTHNASNDAAYTMMALCLFGLQWKRVSKEMVLLPSPLENGFQLPAEGEEDVKVAAERQQRGSVRIQRPAHLPRRGQVGLA
ncbi:hypothetical protein B0A50_04373 [Salinomyces thailandicus]|uniref:Gfd2/YDR514C-like C-terminal domain-containing protein n=1 Tax=Salinomyces thailandicus TaxID=706561 RepID=A0A4U0TYF9_9PEZI|nr:hypothetical protein B0A50_04373 [Salinomyces thailandica]